MLSNIVCLEHVNLNLNSSLVTLAAARTFFCGTLGLREDPRPAARGRAESLLWVNAGLSQLHLPFDAEATPEQQPSQRVDGCIGVLLAPGALAGLAAAAALPVASACPAHVLRCRSTPHLYLPASAATLGTAYLLEEADALDEQHRASLAAARPHPCLPSPGSLPAPATGLSLLQLRVPAAALPHIEAFFAAVLGARTEARQGSSSGVQCLLVHVDGLTLEGYGRQCLCFSALEGEPAPAPAPLPYDGWHAALYLRDFRGAWEAAAAAGLLWDNPRFSDRTGTWEQACQHHQFRTLALGAASGCSLELEVRSLSHPHSPLPPPLPPPPPTPRLLSLQSHVVHGRVGNCAATLPLQMLGWEVSPLNTVHLACHTGYGAPVGQRLGAGQVAEVLAGLRAVQRLGGYSALLTGYTPSAELLGVYGALVEEVRGLRSSAGSATCYVCDPVLGDEEYVSSSGSSGGGSGAGRLYVPPDLIPCFVAHIQRTQPSILTPNAFEAAQLTGAASSIRDVAGALAAMDALHAMGARCVVMTSSWVEHRPGTFLLLASAPWEDVREECGGGGGAGGGVQLLEPGAARRGPLFPGQGGQCGGGHARFGICIPRLPASFTGTGDLTAALLLANSVALPGSFAVAVERSVAAVFSACQRTLRALVADPPPMAATKAERLAATELRVVEARMDFAEPQLPQAMQAFAL